MNLTSIILLKMIKNYKDDNVIRMRRYAVIVKIESHEIIILYLHYKIHQLIWFWSNNPNYRKGHAVWNVP